jgi:hypothetical protein
MLLRSSAGLVGWRGAEKWSDVDQSSHVSVRSATPLRKLSEGNKHSEKVGRWAKFIPSPGGNLGEGTLGPRT